MHSLTEFLHEFEWIESKVRNKLKSPYWITDHSVVLLWNGQLYLRVEPHHLSTRTPFQTIEIGRDYITIFGYQFNETLPFGMDEATYFQESLVHDISKIPLEFFTRCEEVFNTVKSKLS